MSKGHRKEEVGECNSGPEKRGREDMLSKKITDGTELVVFDMEWNQPFSGKTVSNEITVLPGEIIEIGAVKYEYSGGRLNRKDVFSCDIRPVIYKKLHYSSSSVWMTSLAWIFWTFSRSSPFSAASRVSRRAWSLPWISIT